jgi:hypothetical protein
MNARSYRVDGSYSPLDFQVEAELTESLVNWYSEPKMNNNKVVLSITKIFVLDGFTIKNHEVLSVKSVYEIPVYELKSREDVYEFYKDALLLLNEVYQAYRAEMTSLPDRFFPYHPIENYKAEIDRVFDLLNTRN